MADIVHHMTAIAAGALATTLCPRGDNTVHVMAVGAAYRRKVVLCLDEQFAVLVLGIVEHG